MIEFDLIRNWAYERNIIQGTDSRAQFVKLMEEIGELAMGMAAANPVAVQDGVGDTTVVMVVMCAQLKIDIELCWVNAMRNDLHTKLAVLNRHEQFECFIGSVGTLAEGLAKNKPESIERGVGAIMVLLALLAEDTGINHAQCVEVAWNEIKDRKGKMINGIFVKEADLKPCHNHHCECAVGACTHPGYRDARGEPE